MKKILLLLVGMGVLHANEGSSGGLGLGFILGAPTGLSFASGPIQATVAYSFLDNGSLIFGMDYKALNERIPVELKGLFWYLGPGFLVEVFFSSPEKSNPGRAKQSQLWIGAHAVLGVSWFFVPKWELFLEVGPGIYVFPAVNFLVTGGLGLRYYFP